MYEQVEKPKENKNRAVAQKKSNVKQSFGFVDNRTEPIMQMKLQKIHSAEPNKNEKTYYVKNHYSDNIQRRKTVTFAKTNSKIIQRNRAADPHERGTESPQVHHIIPHKNLVDGIGALSANDAREVKRRYLPSANKLTIRQLYYHDKQLVVTNNSVGIAPTENTLDKKNEFFEPWTEAPLSSLNGNKITINNPNSDLLSVTLTTWLNSYTGLVSTGATPPIGNASYWDSLLDSYYEWSGGNLFYGASNRAEPGGANLEDFDSDAKYFRDPKHIEKLKTLSDELEAAKGNAASTKAKLIEIGDLNKDMGAGLNNDRSKWFTPANNNQKAAILQILPAGARKDFINNQVTQKTLPLSLVHDSIEEWSKNEAKDKCPVSLSHNLYTYIFKNPVTIPTITSVNISKNSTRSAGNKVKLEGVITGNILNFNQSLKITIEDLSKSVQRLMQEEFTSIKKTDLGL